MTTGKTNKSGPNTDRPGPGPQREMNMPGGKDDDIKQEPPPGNTRQRPAHPREDQLDVYPLRPADHDPKWAIRLVKAWLAIALFSGAFVITLIVLGLFFD